MPDTYVRLRRDVDLGDGPSIDHRFDNAGLIVDKTSGWLFIHDERGTVASFPQDNVDGVVRSGAAVVSDELA